MTVCSKTGVAAIALAAALTGMAHAAPRTYFEVLGTVSDHAVLQRGEKVVVPGYGEDGDTVTATLSGNGRLVSSAAMVKNGEWAVKMSGVETGGPYELSVSSASGHSLTFTDIMVGEVWVASGQSNMDFKLANSTEGIEWLGKADIPQLRLFHIYEASAGEPQDNLVGSWEASDKNTAKNFSAIGWHFGRRLHEDLDVPIGIIQSAVGGTIVRCWTSEETLRKNPIHDALVADYDRRAAEYPQQYMDFEAGRASSAPGSLIRRRPYGYFNAMIHPLTVAPVAGVIWYQGESDSWNADDYYRLFPDMIRDWRSAWNDEELPFLYVQLAAYAGKDGVDYNYPFLRDAQESALSLPNTAMVTAIDVGEADDIHPKFKRPLGDRLAAAALTMEYGKDEKWQGPIVEKVAIDGNAATVEFKAATGSVKTSDGQAPRGFAVADQAGVFHPAMAEIVGDTTVKVWSDTVAEPKFVRYAWDGFPGANLVNESGLPAYPYRSDSTPWSRQ